MRRDANAVDALGGDAEARQLAVDHKAAAMHQDRAAAALTLERVQLRQFLHDAQVVVGIVDESAADLDDERLQLMHVRSFPAPAKSPSVCGSPKRMFMHWIA